MVGSTSHSTVTSAGAEISGGVSSTRRSASWVATTVTGIFGIPTLVSLVVGVRTHGLAEKTGRDLPIIDLAHLACDGAGIEHRDPTNYALKMWAVFEAMINLLQPEGMADFMASLLPEMIAAMPGPFPAMMKMIKGAPGPARDAMIAMMRPMMPFLFPRLLPGMMPKVMPDMLDAVGERIAMPQHMEEQMPDLMPAAMENLMPKMLPLIIPYFVPQMEAYLKGEATNGR